MKPFVHRISKDAVQLYSGDRKDSIPFLGAMLVGNTVVFKIPGGHSLEVPIKEAVKFAIGIIEVSMIGGIIVEVDEYGRPVGTARRPAGGSGSHPKRNR